MQSCRHKAGNVGHIHHHQGSAFVGNFGNPLKIYDPRIGGSPGHDQLGTVAHGLLFQSVIIDPAGFGGNAVGFKLVILPRKVYGGAVGQMSAMSQAHSQHLIAVFQNFEIDGAVGLCARMGLNIGKVCAEEFFGPFNGDVFHHIHAFATAVVPFARVSFGVFVGQNRTVGGKNRLGNHIFRSNQLQASLLTVIFGFDCFSNLGIHF